ncbi:MAG: hypothetical protein WKG06_26915 [Segetibacter sp.]
MQTLKQILMKALRKLEVTPQDIGRVLLNLFNNAFYAVNEKKKQHLTPEGESMSQQFE